MSGRDGRQVGVVALGRLFDRHDLAAVGLDDIGRPDAGREIGQDQHDADQEEAGDRGKELPAVDEGRHAPSLAPVPAGVGPRARPTRVR
jgi:hypothetical protein